MLKKRFKHILISFQVAKDKNCYCYSFVCEPKVLIADEPTTALDVTMQAQILDLMKSCNKIDTAIIFITHDLGVVCEYR